MPRSTTIWQLTGWTIAAFAGVTLGLVVNEARTPAGVRRGCDPDEIGVTTTSDPRGW